jgi:catechol 2,3-dioxygenase-like lactoylglutathione lyase family enzyme
MKPRVTVLTLAVNDLHKSLAFYRDGLGLSTKGIIGTEFEDGAVALFYMNHDELILSLYPRDKLAKDAAIRASPPSATELSIGHFVHSKAEVDAVMAQAKRAGATITDPAHDRFWGGYSGYFQDLDGHLWEVGWNPQLVLRE